MKEKKTDWNAIAKDYKRSCQKTDDILGYDIVFEMIKKEGKNSTILDYGCGYGKFIQRLEKLNPKKIYGVDISKEALNLRKIPKSAEYFLIKTGDLSSIKDNSIDIAIINFVLCTIENENEIRKILEEIHKKLKKNGKLIILDPHPNCPGHRYVSIKREKPDKLLGGVPIKVYLGKITFYDYWRSKKDYVSLLKKARFQIKDINEPKIKEDKLKTWEDETKQAPTIIILAKK
jgi:ubiquinone/menaquinone biosynthesis C-methylase UbiE